MASKHLDLSKVIIRRARHEDYEQVMNLNTNVFDGYDYLHVNFHTFVQAKRIIDFVALLEGDIVAYKAFYMDGIRETVGIGSRVKECFEGTAVFGKATELVTQEIRNIFPTLERITWCALDNNFYHSPEKMKKYNATVINRFSAYFWRAQPHQWMKLHKANENMPTCLPVFEPSQEEAIKLLQDPQNHNRLFPTGYIVAYYNWLPVLTTDENIRAFVQSHNIAFSMASPSRIAAISYYICELAPLGNLIHFFLAGDNVDSFTYLQHVLGCVEHAIKTTDPNTDVTIAVQAPLTTSVQVLREIVTSYVGPCKSDLMFEKQMGVHAGEWVKPLSKV